MYRIWKVKRPLEKPRHRQAAGNINMNLKETGLEGLEGFTCSGYKPVVGLL